MFILGTKEIIEYQKKVLVDAQVYVMIISPCIKNVDEYLQLIQEANNRKVKIIFIYDKELSNSDDILKLSKIENVELFICPKINAKCLINDQYAVLSSMDFCEISDVNWELGCLILKDFDLKNYFLLEEKCNEILTSAKKYRAG